MAKIVYKLPLRFDIGRSCSVSLPRYSVFLDLQLQNGLPCIWYLFDENSAGSTENRTVKWYFTGKTFPVGDIIKEYLGTLQCPKTGLVYHLFELENQ